MKNCKNCIISMLFLFAFVFSIKAKSEEIVFAFEDYAPYEFVENEKAMGFDTDIIREVCRRIGITPIFKQWPWKRCIHNVKKGDAGAIFSLFNTTERQAFLYFPKENLSFETNVVFAPKNSGIKISGINDLKRFKVGVVNEYAYGEEFDNLKGLTKEFSASNETMLRKLEKNRMDVAVANETVFKYIIKKIGSVETESVLVLSNEPLYVAFSRELGEKGKTLADKFSENLVQIRKEGLIDLVRDKYVKK